MSDEAENMEAQEQPEAPQQEAEATGQDAPPAKVEFTPEQQETFNEAISRKVAKLRETERMLEEERERRTAMEKELQKYREPAVPDIPPPPDPYDDDYEERIAARDEAIRRRVEADARERAWNEMTEKQREAAEQEQMRKLQETAVSYTERSAKLGIKPEQLADAGARVAQFGLKDSVVHRILADEQGPEVTMYLARDFETLDRLSRADDYEAALIVSEIKSKAKASRKAPDIAPEPTETPAGSGMPEGQRGPAGAVYE